MSIRRIRVRLLLAGGLLAVLLLSGCPGSSVPLGEVRIGLALVAGGFASPVALAVPDDNTGRLFIADQVGLIYIIDAAGTRLPEPFLDITGRLVRLSPGGDERGLLGLAFHPNYAQNGRFFVVYNPPLGPSDPAGFDCIWRLSEFHVSAGDPNRADANSEVILQDVLKPQSNHNGGQLAFGPDGLLYAGVGDGGAGGDVGFGHTPDLGNAQDLAVLLGKILRFNVETPGQAAIPADNPFASDPAAQPAIFAYGLRNPWRFSFDLAGDHRLFVADVGQNRFEEVSIVHSGDNLGWHIKEGRHCFDPASPVVPPATCPDTDVNGRPLIDPIIDYDHFNTAMQEAREAVIGGYVYRGSSVPGLYGRYVFGDFDDPSGGPGGTLFVAEEDSAGNWSFVELPVVTNASGRIDRAVLAFGQDLAGEIYILTSETGAAAGTTGEVFKIVAPPN